MDERQAPFAPPIAPPASPVAAGGCPPLAWSANPLVGWLLTEGWNIRDARDLVGRLGDQLNAIGVPVMRVRVTMRTLHPQVIGVSYTWHRGAAEVEEFEPPYSILETDTFLKSPYVALFEGAGAVRRRLEGPGDLDFAVLKELKAEGATDYVALPVVFSDGKINAVTLATDRPGGFVTAELAAIDEAMPVLARLLEVHAVRRTARTLLETYVGRHTGARVLDGLIRRGDGEDIHAVIWFCDLRGSTTMAETMPRRDFLGALNDFFDAMGGAVMDHGGEVLRFIGDAALAIFPIVEPGERDDREACTRYEACRKALAAARDAMDRLAKVNAERRAAGQPAIDYGIGLHIGSVMYGNIGVAGRLEFTVIGAAANETARIEGLCKTLGKPILISAEFARHFPGELASLGEHSLRGVARPQPIFTLPDV